METLLQPTVSAETTTVERRSQPASLSLLESRYRLSCVRPALRHKFPRSPLGVAERTAYRAAKHPPKPCSRPPAQLSLNQQPIEIDFHPPEGTVF